MHFVSQVRAQVRAESFRPRWLGLITNPAYIIRRGLWKAILQYAPEIHGKALDFGCGSKPFESLFTEVDSYTGVDIEVSGHPHADSKVDVYYDGRCLPFNDSEFDA